MVGAGGKAQPEKSQGMETTGRGGLVSSATDWPGRAGAVAELYWPPHGVGINSGMLEALNDWGPECVQP